MKKKIRRLKLERETIRDLTPENLDQAAGAGSFIICLLETVTVIPSCDTLTLDDRTSRFNC